jgi:hypothetical protein
LGVQAALEYFSTFLALLATKKYHCAGKSCVQVSCIHCATSLSSTILLLLLLEIPQIRTDFGLLLAVKSDMENDLFLA